jgi:peptidoglycan/xylan/chitin deacetylase (PgdA/CDA1 family)
MQIRWLTCIAAIWFIAAPSAPAAVVLQYHHVSTDTPPSTSTAPDRFAMHLDYLEQAGFEVVRLEDLIKAHAAGGPLPDRAAAITFDDGYRSIYEAAWPLLKRRGWPFTVFVNSAPHDRGSPLFMSWDQLRELSEGGATIANHTVSHPHLLERLPGQDEAAWRRWVMSEISDAQARIRQEIGAAPKLFAWPFGEFDAALVDVLGELGFTGFGQQSGPLAVFSDPRALPRFPFGGPYGEREDFITKAESLPFPLAAGGDSIRLLTAAGQALDDAVLAAPARPVLMLRLAADFDPTRVECFVSGQGSAALRIEDEWVRVQAERPLSIGRARYNCTAPSAEAGRFHWFSQSWIVRQEPPQ